MNTMKRLALVGFVALAMTACKKEEAPVKADDAQVALTAPAKDDDAAWKQYLKSVVQQNMGTITNNPFLYYLPPESDPEFQAKYDRQAEAAKAAIGAASPGNMLAFGSSASAKMADLIVASFHGVPADTMKGVRVLYIGDAADNARVQAAMAPAGVDYVFVEAK
jgi:hypothetical protein